MAARTFRKIFKDRIPKNLNQHTHKYLLIDATFRFLADANDDNDFIRDNSYINGRHLSFLVQNEGAGASTKNGNTHGVIGVQISPGDIIDYFKDNFTQAGRTRKMFYESQLENYKNDPAWNNQ